MKRKTLDPLAAGLASMNLGTVPTVDVMNEPGGAALAAMTLEKELDSSQAKKNREDPRRR